MFTKKDLKSLREHLGGNKKQDRKKAKSVSSFVGPALMGARFGMFIYHQSLNQENTIRRAREIMAESDSCPLNSEDLSDVPDEDIMNMLRGFDENLHNQLGEWVTDNFREDPFFARAMQAIWASIVDDEAGEPTLETEINFMGAVMGINAKFNDNGEQIKTVLENVDPSSKLPN